MMVNFVNPSRRANETLRAALIVAMSNHLIRERLHAASEIEAVRSLCWRYGLEAAGRHAGEALALARKTVGVRQ